MALDLIIKSRFKAVSAVHEDLISIGYRGVDLEAQQPVRIWQYKKETLTPELTDTLIAEAEILTQINSPHIAKLIDFEFDGDFFYTIYSGIEDTTPFKKWIKNNTLSDKSKWTMATNLLKGLLTLEKAGLIHGHLNFSSLYVDKEGQIILDRPHLPAKVIQHIMPELDGLEDCIFYPPEFIQRQELGPQTDVYSFGVLAFCIFSGKWPYPFTNHLDELRLNLISEPTPIQTVAPDLPEKLKRLIQRSLVKDRSKRYASISDLIMFYQNPEKDPLGAQMVDDVQQELEQWAKTKQKVQTTKKWLKNLIVGTLLILGIAGYWSYHLFVEGIPTKIVPNTVGLSITEAQTLLQLQGLKSQWAGERYDSLYPKDTVIDQKPKAGREVKQDRTIRIYTSKGTAQLKVPDLVGRPLAQSEMVVNSEKIPIDVVTYQYSDKIPSGSIISQIPTPNTMIGVSENIQVVVSKGYPVEVAFTISDRDIELFTKTSIWIDFLTEWSNKDVIIQSENKDKSLRLYKGFHYPGDRLELEYELPVKSKIVIYFDREPIKTFQIPTIKEIPGNQETTTPNETVDEPDA